MKKTFTMICAALLTLAAGAQELKEYKLYTTNFQDWEEASNSTTEKTKSVVTRGSKEDLTISWSETQIAPNGTNSKFTNDVITTGYAMADKKATPYIRTSTLKNITKVEYVHAATGGSRGWGLRMRATGDTEWTTLSSAYCAQAGTKVSVDVNKDNVELEWYNLNSGQNAYMTEFTIYGMAADDGQAAEYTISYYDQNGVKLGDKVQTEEETLVFAYSESDLTIPTGYKFRGWFTSDGVKLRGGEAITGDMRLNAVVTAIETATSTARYEYNLASPIFYAEDHECFVPNGGSYYNEHGWIFQAANTLSLHVSDKAYIILGLCKYSKGDITIKTSDGKDVATFAAAVETDGVKDTIFYDGGATTLTLSFSGSTYIHNVAIYNVKGEVKKNTLGWWQIPAGDGNGLLLALGQLQDGDKVFLPNGLYDFGETVLTPIAKNNISIIGESMEGTVIKNAPDASTESINNTATLLVTGTNTYFQDLTIQNALDYYKANNGRAVCLQDKGTKTICKNVRLLSYQDTYYSNNVGGLHYFEGGSIHGTVDYICGDGNAYFNQVELYCEKRAAAGGGNDAVTASNADKSDKGYVFESCTLLSECPIVSLGRSWNNAPKCVFLNTVVDYSAGQFSFKGSDINRWTTKWMNIAPAKFGEYNTRDTEGNLLTPESNILVFYDDDKHSHESAPMETVLSAEEVANYSYSAFFGSGWDPAADCRQAELSVQQNGTVVSWNAAGDVYLLYVNDELLKMTDEKEFDTSSINTVVNSVSVRAANSRGGFSEAVLVNTGTGVETTKTAEPAAATKRMVNGMLQIEINGVTYNALGQKCIVHRIVH